MAQFLEFILNHPVLAGCWVVTLIAIVLFHRRLGGRAVGPQQAVAMINRQNAVVLDIRDSKEFASGHLAQAINMPLSKLGQRLVELKKYQNQPIVVVCKLGQQSGDAVRTLKENGYQEVYKLAGGISEWRNQSLPLVQG